MTATVSEINTYFGRCRCCLSYGYLKNMWEEHYWDGEKEIYVEMLVQCFALSWEPTEDSKKYDQICEKCVTSLREANLFKKTVLESQLHLIEHIDEEPGSPIKTEQINVVECKEEPKNESTGNSLFIDEPYEDPDDPDFMDPDDSQDMDYENVEYLEDEDKDSTDTQKPSKIHRRTRAPSPPVNRKWPKKLPKSERYKTYKQYTEEELRACLEDVRNEKLTPKEAAEKYNIPRKTIAGKVRSDIKEPNKQTQDLSREISREKKFQFIQEIKLILTYTNATPYKSKANKYACAYCSAEGPYFDNPDDLRTHTRSQHVIDRIQKIEYALRPYWMNEVVKLDIHNLLCVVCCQPISDWNEMFKHLKHKHEVVLDQAYTRAIPYDLTDRLKCALCRKDFTYYMHLDGHMNSHYNNYVCFDCGDTFLAEARLKQHVKTHEIGKHPCSFCDKVFAMYKYKTKHEELVHKQLPKCKCQYCGERFSGEFTRHNHILEKHKDKVSVITCELCGKTFTWRPYYMKHMKLKHDANSKKYKCEECGKKYIQLYELKEHMLRHTGEKHFPCPICNKKYISSGSLKHHLNRHKKIGEILPLSKNDDRTTTDNDECTTDMEYIVVKVENSETT